MNVGAAGQLLTEFRLRRKIPRRSVRMMGTECPPMSAERGSVSVVAVAVGGLALVLAVLIGVIGQLAAARVRVTTAAEAAALAAAPVTFRPFGSSGSPSQVAEATAARNGAELVACTCPLDSTYAPRTVVVTTALTVEVAVLGTRIVTATAAAEFAPRELLGSG